MATSHDHNADFLKREAREEEALKSEIGSTSVGRLDRVVLRDVLYARRRRELDDLLNVPPDECDPTTQRVMVNLSSGRRREWTTSEALKARVGNKKVASPPSVTRLERRRRAAARGRLATDRLVAGLKEHGAEVEQTLWLTHSVVTAVSSDQLTSIASRADVSMINHTKTVFALTLDVSRPLVGGDQVENNLGFTGARVNVAVVDTGVDFSHFALAGSMGSQQDFSPTSEGTGDLHGHGSHCAGVVGSRDGNRRGMAPACTIHDVKLMDQFGATDSPSAVTAIQATVTLGVQVASNSWGFTHADGNWVCAAGDCVLCVAADAASAEGGVIFVVAAGNENNDSCATYDTHLRCPGNARGVITVAASDDSDNMADFSSLGPTPDGRAKPDVTAPGVDIGSVRATTGSDMGGTASPIDANWIDASGTSMACPHVAGLCATMVEKNPSLTTATARTILMATAVDIGATADEMGAGRIDAVAAVNAA